MKNEEKTLTAEQYAELYRRAFGKLADISALAERAMQDLEELQLSMGDE